MKDLVEFLGRYWGALLPPALGFVGIYVLLPQARVWRPLWGALAGGLALVAAGWLLVGNEAALPETVLFYAFSGIAIVGGAMMLTQRNPVHAALSFALVVLSTCGLFLLLAAPFLMAATIIVYAGAIIVTFLFVIMLAQQAGLASADQRSREPFLASLSGFILMGALLYVLQRTYDTCELDSLLERLQRVAQAKTAEEIKAVLGDPDQWPLGKKTPPIVEEVQKAFPHFEVKVQSADGYLNQRPMNVTKLAELFQEIYEHGRKARDLHGSLQPDPVLKLSPFSGTPPNRPAGDKGEATRQLPARNVAALGRSLFTDYLLAVELAGTLLLVASIGAIAIAARRTEGLR